MKIQSVNNYNLFSQNNYQNNGINRSFGLRMSAPLNHDTVSFNGTATIKTAGKQGDMVRHNLAIKVRKIMKEPHEKLKVFLNNEFEDLIESGRVTLADRIKGEYSIRQKTGSRLWGNEDSIMSHMTDISGFCFILEDKKAFNDTINRFMKLIKSNKIRVARSEEISEGLPVEYHRIPPMYKRGQVAEEYEPFNPAKIQEFKNTLINTYQPASRMSDTIDSVSGYSALHVIVKNPDGTFSEIKFMDRTMADVHKVENLFYKVRNGKNINPKYSYLETILAPLKPLSEYATEAEKKEYEKLIKAVSKYTTEVYKFALKNPYIKNAELPIPTDPLIEQYDFNKLRKLMEACENM